MTLPSISISKKRPTCYRDLYYTKLQHCCKNKKCMQSHFHSRLKSLGRHRCALEVWTGRSPEILEGRLGLIFRSSYVSTSPTFGPSKKTTALRSLLYSRFSTTSRTFPPSQTKRKYELAKDPFRHTFSPWTSSLNSTQYPKDMTPNALGAVHMKREMPLLRSEGLLANFWKAFNAPGSIPANLFNAYLQLPNPRLRYLSQEQIYCLLNKLSDIRTGDEPAMLRYLTVIDDMKNGKVPIPRLHWNMAIGFVHKCYQNLTEHDVQSGLFLWKEMERTSGVKADVTTFNILFHLATDSEMAHLPLMILKEMKRRKIRFDRFSYVNMIMYYGKQGNGEGLRHAYQELVESGEIVDIVVLNAVMTALVAAGEPQAAEDILTQLKRPVLRTKGLSTQARGKTRRLYKDLKELKLILKSQGFGSNFDFHELPPVPDLISFAIFINYHASETADFAKILVILHELAECRITSETSVYQLLFKGFALHGNVKYTPWTLRRLEAVFEAFMDGDYPISRDAAVWCLRAYRLLAGTERKNVIWQTIKERWMEQGGGSFDIWDVEDRSNRIRPG